MSSTKRPTTHNIHPQNGRNIWNSTNIRHRHESTPFDYWTHCQQEFVNKLKHQNVTDKRQHTHKNTSQHYQNINTIQQYHHINTDQQYQHRHPSQKYQPRSFQRHRKYSIKHIPENCLGCGLNNTGVRELLMQHDGAL